MKQEELNGIWNYYLSLEKDLDNTSAYVEPKGQEGVYSFEFFKIIILACTEIESIFKLICKELGENKGDICGYKTVILAQYPTVVNAEILIKRLEKSIKPFENWNEGPLKWWKIYQLVKHNMAVFFQEASYINAVSSLGALYVLIFFLAHLTGLNFEDYKSTYIQSDYQSGYVLVGPNKRIPDFKEMGMIMDEN